jgi:hypothetical protein
MNAIQSHPPQQAVATVTTVTTATTVTIDLAELPELGFIRRLALRVCLALIVRVEPPLDRDAARRVYLERLARAERERNAERVRRTLSTTPWR